MASALSKARLAHHIEGRTRFRIRERQGQLNWFSSVVKSFATLDGVLTVTARPETASVLICHRLPLERLERHAIDHDLFDIEDLGGEHDPDTATFLADAKWEGAAALALVAISAWQASRGELFGPAITHIMQAVSLMRNRG